ncbi:MAG: T9SS type A sorting domain-containing protein [Bacteroidetes bacterium]|nr:T9SS type A sorting domain-containing protein [Bacteroidota bacterium]
MKIIYTILLLNLLVCTKLHSQPFSIIASSTSKCNGDTVSLSTTPIPTYIPISLSSIANYTATPNAPVGSQNYSGVPFFITTPSDWDSYVAAGNSGQPNSPQQTTITLSCPMKVDKLHTLINTHWGQQDATLTHIQLTFTNNSTLSIPLIDGVNIRDHHEFYVNSFSSTTTPVSITTINVWNGIYLGDSFRRDMQEIAIPFPENTYFLKDITIIDSGNNNSGFHRAFVSGITVKPVAAPIVWHLGSPNGTILPNAGSPNYQTTVQVSGSTTYFATSTSFSCDQSIVINGESCCIDTCFWTIQGNVIHGGKNIFGTLSPDNVRIQTNASNRGILSSVGLFGWNTMNPSTLFHVDCKFPINAPSSVRLENLQYGTGQNLVIDKQGYVYVSERDFALNQKIDNLENQIKNLKEEIQNLKANMNLNPIGTPLNITCFPNPAKEFTTLQFSKLPNGRNLVYSLKDVGGKIIQTQSFLLNSTLNFEVRLPQLAPGAYIIEIMSNEEKIGTVKLSTY